MDSFLLVRSCDNYLFFSFFEPGKMIFGHDLVLASNDYIIFMNELLRKGEIPFWNPYSYSGTPCLDALTPIFYPTYFIYPLFNLSPAFFALFEYMICIFLSGSFMYLYAENIGLSKTGSFLTGIFFMFSGNIITLINAGHILNIQAITYIPIILYFLIKGSGKIQYFIFFLPAVFRYSKLYCRVSNSGLYSYYVIYISTF